MKVRCAHCREVFEASPSQFKELSPHGLHYCSRKCRPFEQPERRPLVPEDLYTGGRELHLRVARKRGSAKDRSGAR